MASIECFIHEKDRFLDNEAIRVSERGGLVAKNLYILFYTYFPNGNGIVGNEFVVAGAKLTGCVLELVDVLLVCRATNVTVDLPRCRDESELGFFAKHLNTFERRDKFITSLPGYLKNDARIQYIVESNR